MATDPPYYGRGYLQLTHQANYAAASQCASSCSPSAVKTLLQQQKRFLFQTDLHMSKQTAAGCILKTAVHLSTWVAPTANNCIGA